MSALLCASVSAAQEERVEAFAWVVYLRWHDFRERRKFNVLIFSVAGKSEWCCKK